MKTTTTIRKSKNPIGTPMGAWEHPSVRAFSFSFVINFIKYWFWKTPKQDKNQGQNRIATRRGSHNFNRCFGLTLSMEKEANYQRINSLLFEAVEHGELAQMVERSLSMWEVPGSIPGFSIHLFAISSLSFFFFFTQKPDRSRNGANCGLSSRRK